MRRSKLHHLIATCALLFLVLVMYERERNRVSRRDKGREEQRRTEKGRVREGKINSERDRQRET